MSSIFNDYPAIPTDATVDEVADWCEVRVAATQNAFARSSLEGDLNRASYGDYQSFAIDVFSELSSRDSTFSAVGGRPVLLDPSGSTLEYQGGGLAVFYLFFAALGVRDSVKPTHRALFEHVTALALRGLGLDGVLRLGHPRDGGLPTSLDQAVDVYCLQSRTRKHTPLPSTDKDLGLDVAAWRTFKCDRGYWMHVLAQCATGYDWSDKLHDLDIPQWESHVTWSPAPLRALSIPFFAPTQRLERHGRKAGLILDRPRLMELLDSPGARGAGVYSGIVNDVTQACASFY